MVPSGRAERKPHGARSNSSSAVSIISLRGSAAGRLTPNSPVQVGLHGGDGLRRGTQVGAVPRGLELDQSASGQVALDEGADRRRSNGVLRALEDQGGDLYAREIQPIIRQEGDPGKVPRDLRISPTEAAGELRGELR